MNSNKKEKTVMVCVTIALILCSVLSFSVPNAFAQDNNLENQNYFNEFQNAFNFILENYVDEIDPKVLYEGAMTGLFDAIGDPYSQFLTEEMLNDLSDTTVGRFGGLGINISKPLPDPKNPSQKLYIEVVSPIEDTPGWRAGIQPGDFITHINGESVEPITMNDVLKRLRGDAGSEVTITILRGEKLSFDVTLERAIIEVPTVKKSMLPNNIAYLRIIEFTPQTTQRVKEALSWFKEKKYSSLIIDLRNNPGGLLSSVNQIADLFLDKGVIVSTRSRNRYDSGYFNATSSISVPKDIRVVVLINKGSASASEILAGALKDHKRAYLVGENSYGKGSVQQVRPSGETGYKLTMSRYYTPSEANIDKTGIGPDLIIAEPEFTEEEETSLLDLIERNVFESFAKENPNATVEQINSFVKKLKTEGCPVSDRILRKLVRNQIERTTISADYDLDYDIQLVAAIEAITSKDFEKLVSNTKTVRELQLEKAVSETAPALK